MSKRKKPTLSERYAAVILDLKFGNGESVVNREKAKHLTAGEIIEEFESVLQFDHGIHVAIDGTNHPTNLTPRLTADHREKTNKIDIPQIAKTKRITKAQAEFQRKILAKAGLADDVEKTETKPASRWPQGRKLQSRGFPKKPSNRVGKPA